MHLFTLLWSNLKLFMIPNYNIFTCLKNCLFFFHSWLWLEKTAKINANYIQWPSPFWKVRCCIAINQGNPKLSISAMKSCLCRVLKFNTKASTTLSLHQRPNFMVSVVEQAQFLIHIHNNFCLFRGYKCWKIKIEMRQVSFHI